MTAKRKEHDARMIDRRSFIGWGTMLAATAIAGSDILRAFPLDTDGKPGPTVETTAGKLRGLTLDGNIYTFKGVRYGTSTAGAGRFMPPMKLKPWSEVRDAFDLGPRSPQGSEPTVFSANAKNQAPATPRPAARPQPPMSEDCLCLNVWTGGIGDGTKRPVMLWLHGGGYSVGSGGGATYDGANLAKKHDVVVVTINHRLNVFGYLYLAGLGNAKYAKSSNLGMLDIVASLEWVRDNIAKFGGDPHNVTIFGQSGGGGKVSTLMAMPSAKGLFHRAIVESGADVKGIPPDEATKATQSLLTQLQLKSSQLDDLQNLPMERLLSAQAAVIAAHPTSFRMAPVTDGHTLPRDPFNPVAPAMSANIPLLIGTVETEVTFFPGEPLDPIDDATLHERVKQAIHCSDTQADHLIDVYRKGRPNISNTDLYLILASDNRFRAPVLIEAERKAAEKAPVYMYYFTWRSPARDGKLRTPHTIELPFVFDNVDAAKQLVGEGADRYALADKVSGAWTAFARTGDPNHKDLPDWPAFDTHKRATMILNHECKVVDDPGHDERLALNAVLRSDRG